MILNFLTLATVVGPARLGLRQRRQHLHQAGCDTVRRTLSTLHRLHAHIQAASPERYFALGLSYVTGPDRTVVRSRSQVSSGDRIEIHVIDGRIEATVTTKEHGGLYSCDCRHHFDTVLTLRYNSPTARL